MYRLPRIDVIDVVALVNEYADATRVTAGEQGLPYPHLPALEAVRAGQATKVGVADRLHPVFAIPSAAPALLNHLVAEVALHPYLDKLGAREWAVPSRRSVLLASGVASLLEWVADHGLDRHGTCDADRCVDVYVDTSSPGTRRYCSASCLNRDRVASWRARQHGGAHTSR